MYYPSSENKGADQLRGYREADLRLCFRLGKNPVFSRCGSNHYSSYNVHISARVLWNAKELIELIRFVANGTQVKVQYKVFCSNFSRVFIGDVRAKSCTYIEEVQLRTLYTLNKEMEL